MAAPLSVLVRRGGVVEAVHRVHAVAVRDGEIVASAGDPQLVAYMRSSSKPFQALPLARARADVDLRELAIASASHLARPEQLDAVRSLLAKAGAGEDDLECGAERGSRLNHNCSGKHAAMLAVCRAHGWTTEGYGRPDHPLQLALRDEHVRAAETDVLAAGGDGCGVVTFALPLWRMAHAFSRLERVEGGSRVAEAMRTHPDLIRGPGSPDTELMRHARGWVAKVGAEGLLCAAGPDGLAVALKCEDGNSRGLAVAAAAFFRRVGVSADALAEEPVRNSRGEVVGEIVAAAANV